MPKNKPINNRVKLKRSYNYLVLVSCIPLTAIAIDDFTINHLGMNDLEVVLDGYAHTVDSNVIIDFDQQSISFESDIENCLRPGSQAPLNNANLTLITNKQNIGLERFRYSVEGRLLFLTSESSNLICDNGIFVDQIFVNGFE